jgi:hypothetical protein
VKQGGVALFIKKKRKKLAPCSMQAEAQRWEYWTTSKKPFAWLLACTNNSITPPSAPSSTNLICVVNKEEEKCAPLRWSCFLKVARISKQPWLVKRRLFFFFNMVTAVEAIVFNSKRWL